MNIVLFESAELSSPLLRSDLRAHHILEVLKRKEGDTFDAGEVNGSRGKATVMSIQPAALTLSFAWSAEPPPLPPLNILVGLPRPQTARKILQDLSALGVGTLQFVPTERGESSYAASTLWSSGEWRRHLIAGAAQAFCTRLPEVTVASSLADSLSSLPQGALLLGLDNYEAASSLAAALASAQARISLSNTPVFLALGAERGWTGRERDLLRAQGFTLVHLGPRVLRSETACVAAVAIVKSALGWL